MRITANQITLARMVLLPLPCIGLMNGGDHGGWLGWSCFLFAVFLGATDFIDGYLARKHGSTVLGSLLDPVADKLFIAILLSPFVVLGHRESSPFHVLGDIPAWSVAAILLREFLITALRTTLSLRNTALKTSKLGKMKTIIQMGALGTLFLTFSVPWEYQAIMHGIMAILLGITGIGIAQFRGKPMPFWVIGTVSAWLVLAAICQWGTIADSALYQFAAAVILTWVSGIDYVVGASKILLKEGIRSHDATRILWSFGVAIGSILLLRWVPHTLTPVLFVLGAEFMLGGIDNMVSAALQRPPKALFIISGILGIGAIAGVLAMIGDMPILIMTVIWAFYSVFQALYTLYQEWNLFRKIAD